MRQQHPSAAVTLEPQGIKCIPVRGGESPHEHLYEGKCLCEGRGSVCVRGGEVLVRGMGKCLCEGRGSACARHGEVFV